MEMCEKFHLQKDLTENANYSELGMWVIHHNQDFISRRCVDEYLTRSFGGNMAVASGGNLVQTHTQTLYFNSSEVDCHEIKDRLPWFARE